MKMNNDPDSREMKRKIKPEDVSTGLRPDEIGRILNLKKDLDYSDVLSKYACRYLKIGWDLVAVTPRGKADLDLDFHQDQEIWANRLAELGMEGVQVNLGVRTGPASNLLVLEIKPEDVGLPFEKWDDWRSGCVAEVGGGWEQHYYVLPPGWPAPSSVFLDPHRLMVFGAGGLVLAPPSLEPRVQENLRWLRPPWENPPSRPSSRLWQFLLEHIPTAAGPAWEEEPHPPAWEEIYGTISVHPGVLQVLLAPAPSPEEYYQQVLHTAVASGLTDPQVLLGLLWHAPLGDARSRPQGLQELQKLIAGTLKDRSHGAMDRVTVLLQELQGAFAALSGSGGPGPGASLPPGPPSFQGEPPPPGPPNFSPPGPPPETGPGPGTNFTFPGHGQNFNLPEVYGPRATRVLWRPRESISVERDRYEAMLYELGKLGAWHEIHQEHSRELKTLKEKIEAQQQKEISRLRRLCTQNQGQNQKKDKSWWR
jgi:hypothetical protein